MKTKDLAIAALFACIIAIGALITIPTPLVPFTLQVFAISLTACFLTRTQTILAYVTYVFMGLIGLPVFSGGVGGFQIIASPTFGFILGFLPLMLIINTYSKKFKKPYKPFAFLLGSFALYAIGLPVLYFNVKLNTGFSIPLSKLIVSYCLIFLPTDFLSMGLSYFASRRIK